MRLLTVGNMYPPHHFGGYEQVWRASVEHLRARGHVVRVLTTDTRTDTAEPDDPDVHRTLRWHLRDGEFEPLSPRERLRLAHHNHAVLREHLAAFAPDVVAWWSMGGLTLTLVEDVRRHDLPAVAFVHDAWLEYGPAFDPWLPLFTGRRRSRTGPLAERITRLPTAVAFEDAAEYVFVSDHVRRQALERFDLHRTSVAHSGIHRDFLDPAPEQPWRWRLLYVGRLDPRKGVDTAIEALAHLPVEATLDVYGGWDTGEERRLRELAGGLGVGERVRFGGQADRARLMDAYAECDAVVFPVVWEEPWGLVPLEAMGRGRPVVATGRGGSGEYLRDGTNCLLFEAGDAARLAAAVRTLAGDADLRHALRAGGFDTAPRHTEDHLNRAVEAALLRAVSGPEVRAA